MGWEYHNRQRGSAGRYVAYMHRRTTQMHLRMKPKQAEIIRNQAIKNHMGLSEYVLHCIAGYWEMCSRQHTR